MVNGNKYQSRPQQQSHFLPLFEWAVIVDYFVTNGSNRKLKLLLRARHARIILVKNAPVG